MLNWKLSKMTNDNDSDSQLRAITTRWPYWSWMISIMFWSIGKLFFLVKNDLAFYPRPVLPPRTDGSSFMSFSLYSRRWSTFLKVWFGLIWANFFVELACKQRVLDGDNWHYQASVHCTEKCHQLTSATSKFPEKNWGGDTGIWTQGRWVGSKYAIHSAM